MATTAQQEVTTPAGVRNGDFVWHELRTTDARAAEEFYSHVVGWQPKSSGDPGGIPYTLLSTGGLDVAGLMQLSPSMLAEGMRPAWVGFVGVDDVDAYAHRLEQAGGKLHCPPQDIPGIGRFASVEDPQGAVFLLFKGTLNEAPPRPAAGTPGTVSWNELAADDAQAAWLFYSGLFGWKEERIMDMGPAGIYRIFNHGGPALGGMMNRDAGRGSIPFWLYYFQVDDIEAAVTRIREKNGTVHMEPHEVPGGIWIVLATDPQGAQFAVVGPKNS